MADQRPPAEFVNALGTEYFVLQSTASSTIGESGSRVRGVTGYAVFSAAPADRTLARSLVRVLVSRASD
jgi:hypothetical protein